MRTDEGSTGAGEMNRLYQALADAREPVLDLIDTNFHRCGFRFPAAPLAAAFADYLAARSYDPDPLGSVSARDAIADYYRNAGVAADRERILLTASTSEAYRLLFTVLCRPGDAVALPWPSYPLFEHLVEHQSLRPVYYRAEPSNDFALSAESVERALAEDVRALVLISPNNPTGLVASERTVRDVLAVCADRGIPIICDEVFVELSDVPVARPASIAGPEAVVYTLNGCSKLFASPDVKLAWILANGGEDETVRVLWEALAVANDMYLDCSPIAQHLLPTLFSHGRSFVERMRTEVSIRRRTVREELEDCPGGRLVRPEAGVHALFALDPGQRASPVDDEEVAVGLIQNEHLFVHPGYLYGLEADAYLVLSCLPPPDRIREGCRRLRRYLERRRG